MKKFVDNSKLAQFILMGNYLAITLGPKAFSKRVFDQKCKNHECTHMRQWAEWTILSFIIFIILIGWLNISPWWGLSSLVIYYILYIFEWIIRLFINGSNAYRRLSFEQEAYDHENDDNYNTNSNYFESLKYLFKK